MCEKCYVEEVLSFLSGDDFLVFDKELTLKLDKGILQVLGNIPDEFGQPKFKLFGIGFGSRFFQGYLVCKCNHCGQIWNYSQPDNAWRGYFRKSDINPTVKRKVKLMPEYGCFPIWIEGNDIFENVTVETEQLNLSAELQQQLLSWDEVYQSTLNQTYPPESCFSSNLAAVNFDNTGKEIWQKMKDCLKDYEIEYHFNLSDWIKVNTEAREYIIEQLTSKGLRFEVHDFPSKAVMIDIWKGEDLIVIQLLDDVMGISIINDENPAGFDTIPDQQYRDFEEFKNRFTKAID